MNTSESIAKIAPALLKAQKAITFATKDATNPHYKSKYADLPAVIDACKKALNDAGIVFMQFPAPSEPGTLAMATRLLHESGEWIEGMATCPLPKSDPQGYGSACTYVRRYSLAAAVGLYQDDDDGQAATPKASAKPVTVDVWDSLDEETQKWLQNIADCVRVVLSEKGPDEAIKTLADEGLTAEHKTAVWSRFDSKERAALKGKK